MKQSDCEELKTILWSTPLTYESISIIDYFLSSDELYNPCLITRSNLPLDSNYKLMIVCFNILEPLQVALEKVNHLGIR